MTETGIIFFASALPSDGAGWVFFGIVWVCVMASAVLLVKGHKEDKIKLVFLCVDITIVGYVGALCGFLSGILPPGLYTVLIPALAFLTFAISALVICTAKKREAVLKGCIALRLKDDYYYVFEPGQRPVVKIRASDTLAFITAVGLLQVSEDELKIVFACNEIYEGMALTEVKDYWRDEGWKGWFQLTTNKKLCPFDYKEVLGELEEYFGAV